MIQAGIKKRAGLYPVRFSLCAVLAAGPRLYFRFLWWSVPFAVQFVQESGQPLFPQFVYPVFADFFGVVPSPCPQLLPFVRSDHLPIIFSHILEILHSTDRRQTKNETRVLIKKGQNGQRCTNGLVTLVIPVVTRQKPRKIGGFQTQIFFGVTMVT